MLNFCTIASRNHFHDAPAEALIDLLIDLGAWGERVARVISRNAQSGPVSRYRDTVMHGFIEDSSRRLNCMSALSRQLRDAVCDRDLVGAQRLMALIRAEGAAALGAHVDFAAMQREQRSGRRKDEWIEDVYGSVHVMFAEFAALDPIASLVTLVITGEVDVHAGPEFLRGAACTELSVTDRHAASAAQPDRRRVDGQ